MVSRYTHGDKCGGEYNCYAILDKEGDFVCYDDYKLLEAENAKLKEALQEIKENPMENIEAIKLLEDAENLIDNKEAICPCKECDKTFCPVLAKIQKAKHALEGESDG